MKIVLVAGMPGSGKEELLGVARAKGLPFLRMGDLVREAHSSSRSELSVGGFAGREREIHGKDVWAKRAVERMSGALFLVDGCRSPDEVLAFRSLGEKTAVLGIHSSPGERYRRLVARGRGDAPKNPDEFRERDAREIGWGLAEVLALADIMIPNDSGLEEFRARCAQTLDGLL